MKAIMYISQATNHGIASWMPHDYAAITKVCQKNNVDRDITGILNYQDGYFLHYIEGPTAKIDRLIVKIAGDQRHENIQLLLNHDIADRNFSKWNMAMGSKLRKDQEFARFVNLFNSNFINLSGDVKQTLEKFYDFKSSSVRSAKEKLSPTAIINNKHQNHDVLTRLFGEYKNRLATQMID
jgi:hypothetical protein